MKNINQYITEKIDSINWNDIKLTETDKKNIKAFSYKKSTGELCSLEQTVDWVWKLKEDSYKILNETVDGWLSQLGITKKVVKRVEHMSKDANERYINAYIIRTLAIDQKIK